MPYTGKGRDWNNLNDWFSVGMIARNGIVAALYFVLSFAANFMSYGMIQFRLSEILNLLVFFNPAYTVGVTFGCLLSNILGAGLGLTSWWDLLIGTGCTLIACLMMLPLKNLFLATLPPVIVNGVGVGLELYYLFGGQQGGIPLWVEMGWVALGEVVVVCIAGYAIFMCLRYFTPKTLKLVGAVKNTEFKW